MFLGLESQQAFANSNDDQTQTGAASWYGSKYHGRKTSSGERYNKNEMTAAHKTLPFGTKVKVTNLANNKSVIVRINDRGPFVGHRIIDVSEAAARKIRLRSQGVAKVKIEILEPGSEIALVEKLPMLEASLEQTPAPIVAFQKTLSKVEVEESPLAAERSSAGLLLAKLFSFRS
ncbi:septal ring lytic transglycosylase RlpA family protein [Pontibacter silvestris]|uniref:Probable endolytic peptidoglycan transglycosylase RlpA n=2 Tax=Pontibacter silvestris TaxID=2305183 RepID=A0ABW4X266_9BACT|nr:septal ring lytic transglycosylase RlpA family protein [Pontibacter silvestris]MCC9135802.1 septal ring lytic transglycosylase RlpA family protein [Pontibacter silvestris]